MALLRDEALVLAQSQSVTREQVDGWRTRTAAVLAALYGADSEPVRDFSRIRFDYADVVDVAERVHTDKAAEQGSDISGLKIQLPPSEKALRAGLYEAADLLTSLMICT